MSELRLTAKLYIATLAIAALGLTLSALAQASMPAAERALLTLVLAGLVVVGFLFQLPFGFKVQLSLGSSAVVATILLFEPGIAMLVVGGGTTLAYAIRRRELAEVLFNGSQIALQAGVAGLILARADWQVDNLLSNGLGQALMIPVAASAMYLLNTLSVATIVALQSGSSILMTWRRALSSGQAEELLQLALGILVAVVVDIHVSLLLLLLLPAFGLYRWAKVQRERAASSQPVAPELGRLSLSAALLERKQELYWVLGAGSVVVASVTLLVVHLPGDVPITYPGTYALTVFAAGIGAVLVAAPRWLTSRAYLFWPLAGGLFPLLEALVVYFTGGIQSPFFVLFYFSLFFLGMVGGHRGAALGSSIAGILYIAACTMQLQEDDLRTAQLHLGVTLLSFYGIAFFAAFLANIAWQEARTASRRAARLIGLNSAHTALSGIGDLDALLEKIPGEACERLGFERALLWMANGDALHLEAGHSRTDSGQMTRFMSYLEEHPLRLDSQALVAEAARTRRAILSPDQPLAAGTDPLLEMAGGTGFAAAPLVARNQLIGVLVADYGQDERPVTEEDLVALATFARIAGIAVTNIRLVLDAGRAEAFRHMDALKSDFLATVSHDLSTQVTLIKSSAELLQEDLSEGLLPVQKYLIDNISRNSLRLGTFMEEILEVAQLEEGWVELSKQIMDLRYVVEDVARTLDLLVKEKQQVLHLELPNAACLVEIDRHRMEQVVTNLITNACKYTPEGGKLCVRVSMDWESIVVEVEDNGPGIPPGQMEHIFQKFYRLPGSDQRAKGTGLGLTIARSLVELHGGVIEVDSVLGEGTKFWFTLRPSPCADDVVEWGEARVAELG